ncbi:hypothetical protein SteCoe_2382 [Stentor coeruleus]|uniref:Uncharacterized protein n=1 Tax=Stentor coeruleus TaxID=5963 RepID=A0A1R2CZP0_9CILI|nr:hypothetical protein SteCoe_2382 [Stentor coeruleus]
MSDNPIVKDLVNKLKLFRQSVMSISKGGSIRSSLVPPAIREEAGKIYLEHGGLDILMDVLHVSAEQIREWTRNLKSSSDFYSCKKTKGIIQNFINCNKLPQKRHKTYKAKISGKAEILNTLTPEIQIQCENLKTKIEESRQSNQIQISKNLKIEIANLVKIVGHPKPIASIIGINEHIISIWSNYYSTLKNDSNIDMAYIL